MQVTQLTNLENMKEVYNPDDSSSDSDVVSNFDLLGEVAERMQEEEERMEE